MTHSVHYKPTDDTAANAKMSCGRKGETTTSAEYVTCGSCFRSPGYQAYIKEYGIVNEHQAYMELSRELGCAPEKVADNLLEDYIHYLSELER